MEIDKPRQVEKRSGKDRRQSFLNSLDRRQSVGQGEDGPQEDSDGLVETDGVEQITLSQSESNLGSN
jgi:hypothetical protein